MTKEKRERATREGDRRWQGNGGRLGYGVEEVERRAISVSLEVDVIIVV
jgi:hypothetical protein